MRLLPPNYQDKVGSPRSLSVTGSLLPKYVLFKIERMLDLNLKNTIKLAISVYIRDFQRYFSWIISFNLINFIYNAIIASTRVFTRAFQRPKLKANLKFFKFNRNMISFFTISESSPRVN